MIQDGNQLLANPDGDRSSGSVELGATTVRVVVFWYDVTKSPRSRKVPSGFNATDPNAYPTAGWAPYDTIIRDAKQDGMTVDLTVAGGAPVPLGDSVNPRELGFEPSSIRGQAGCRPCQP